MMIENESLLTCSPLSTYNIQTDFKCEKKKD